MIRILMICTLILFATTGLAAPKEKVLICHVGNETGPGGEDYLDDPDCTPSEDNGYFCPDAGKIDLILVAQSATHLDNPAHTYDGISDYEPGDVGASGEGTEDSDGNGIDDGCEPQEICPCWDVADLQSVTAENHYDPASCEYFSVQYPFFAVLQNDDFLPEVEGGFAARSSPSPSNCETRDFPPYYMEITPEEADVCIAQIAARCAEIGHPITP